MHADSADISYFCQTYAVYDCNDGVTGFAPFSIRQLLQYDLLEQLDKLQVVGTSATKESSLEKALVKMQADWEGVAFRVVEYKDTGTFVVGGTDEVQVGVSATLLLYVESIR